MLTNKTQMKNEIFRFRTELLEKMPFFGDIVMNLEFLEDASIPTACTDGLRVYYNSDFMMSLLQGERFYVLMHEVMHILLMHPMRSRGYKKRIFNIAADVVVNMHLDAMGREMQLCDIPFQRPESAVHLNSWNHFSGGTNLENIYASLLEKNPGEEGKKSIFIPSSILTGPKNWGEDWKLPLDSDEYSDLCQKSPVTMDGSFTPIEEVLKEYVRNATVTAEKGRSIGISVKIPEQILSLNKKPPLNWKKLLRNMLDEVIDEECSYVTPERKYLHMDLIIPGRGSYIEAVGDIWAFIDSSGSVSTGELEDFLTQLYHILRQFKCTLNIAFWDTAVTDVYSNIRTKEELMKAKPKHSGGTDINCVFEWMSKNRIKPECLLILTDGYFGTLQEQYQKAGLRKKTIVVLSSDLTEDPKVTIVGKVAPLNIDSEK